MKIAREVVLGTAIALATLGHASAQDWPTRNVTVVVPIPAGVASDIIARVVFEQVGRQVGQWRTCPDPQRPDDLFRRLLGCIWNLFDVGCSIHANRLNQMRMSNAP